MKKTRKKVAVVINSSANYASIKAVLTEILKRPDSLELLIFVGASALLDRYGQIVNTVEEDGFAITEKFYILLEGENPQTMAMSTGLGMIELAGLFMNHKPNIVLTVGDRFETLATAATATYMNIVLAHTMGGEVSGTIDESVRHAVTKFAHLHFPANQEAADRIIKMGEDEQFVYVTGCPRLDLMKQLAAETDNGIDEEAFWLKYKGVGGQFELNKGGFLLVTQHPVTTEYGQNRTHVRETLMALQKLNKPTIMLWPNMDAGSDEVSKEIRTFRESHKPDTWLHVFTNLPVEIYMKLMVLCDCMVGNSSSAIREGAIIGVPSVNIGTRQKGRTRGNNVIDVNYNKDHIQEAIQRQISHGRYDPDFIYGDGQAGKKIAEILSTIDLDTIPIQKRITY